MRKLMAVGAMLALMLVSTAPAFANAVGGDVDLRFVDASQTQAAALQVIEGDATAGNLGSAAAIDQSLTIEQSQVNAGWGGVAAGDDVFWWGWW
jgi:hypothetical protein